MLKPQYGKTKKNLQILWKHQPKRLRSFKITIFMTIGLVIGIMILSGFLRILGIFPRGGGLTIMIPGGVRGIGMGIIHGGHIIILASIMGLGIFGLDTTIPIGCMRMDGTGWITNLDLLNDMNCFPGEGK